MRSIPERPHYERVKEDLEAMSRSDERDRGDRRDEGPLAPEQHPGNLRPIAEEQLFEANQRLKMHIDHSSLGVVEWVRGYRIVRWTGEAERIFGWRADEAIGRRIDELHLIHEDDLPSVSELMASMLAGERPQTSCINRNRRKDGSVVECEWHNSIVTDPDGRLVSVLSLCMDITDRRAAESRVAQLLEKEKETRTQLELAVSELEGFSYSISHDLRAPLRAIDGFCRILLMNVSQVLSAEDLRYLHLILQNAHRMSRLIDELLQFTRLSRQPVIRHSIDFRALLDEVIHDLQPAMRNRSVQFTIADLPYIRGDEGLMRQVMTSLLSNAVKFTAKRIHAHIEVGTTQESGRRVFYVRDNGVGFDMKYSNRLFGVFERLHHSDEYEGTGVGLALAQRIITKHGGRIWAEAELDKGAAFYFTIQEDS